MRTTALCVGTLALGLSVIGVSTAHADEHEEPTIIVERFDDEFSDIDFFLTEVCGFEVLVDGHFRGTVRFRADGSIHVTEQGTVVLSNPATDKTLTRFSRLNFKGTGSESVDENGILTITFDDIITGIPERWFGPDGKELIKDRGYARFVGEIVVDLGDPEDPFDDELLHFHEDITTHGPHPILESGLDPFTACELLS